MPDNLPVPRTSFVGRTDELLTLTRIVPGSGLLTLTGAGGSGKTRLLIQFAHGLTQRFAGGVWWVDLSPVSHEAAVARAIASALHLGLQADAAVLVDLLVGELRGRARALLLDNCEHVLDGVAEMVDTLTGSCPGLLVLATSREPLRIAGEVTYVVPPLNLGSEAIDLFIERARAVDPGFSADEEDRRVIGDICQRLDAIPLAIELAAPWVRMMPLQELQNRLADRFGLLVQTTRGVAERQRTLRAAVDWSHDRLGAAERMLFRRLSVFSESFSLAAAEVICSDGSLPAAGVLPTLTRLHDQSMVGSSSQIKGPARYRLLETLREYGAEQLRSAGEGDAFQRRHFEHFLEAAEAADECIRTTGSDEGLLALVPDMDNMRAALRWSMEADPDGALALAGALDQLWTIVAAAEGRRWIEQALARTSSPSAARARALTATVLPATDPSWPRACERIEEALGISTERADARGRAWALHMMGLAAWLHGKLDVALDYLRQALPLHEELGSQFAVERTALELGCSLINVPGGTDEGVEQLHRVRSLARALHDSWAEQYAFSMLAQASLDRGDVEGACAHLRAALACGDKGTITSIPLAALARVLVDRNAFRAAVMLASAQAVNERMAGRSMFHIAVPNHQRGEHTLETVRQALGPERLGMAWDEGHAMTSDQAIASALATLAERGAVHPGRPALPGGLTAREAEIARLVAEGMGNREIARHLHLSVRTVETHLDHIFTKLGLNTRTRLAAWTREAGLSPAAAGVVRRP